MPFEDRLQNLMPLPAEDILPVLAAACGDKRPERLLQIYQSYRQSPRQLLGWTRGEQVVALAGLRLDGRAATLQHLAVAPGLRGRGFGRKLLKAICRELRLYRLDAETDRDAVGFYRRCGWTVCELGPNAWGAERYGAWWVDPDALLAPDFRFPRPQLDRLRLPANPQADIRLLRLDTLHPLLGGNKWFKLRPQLILARNLGLQQLVTLGGAWSNHLFASAAACQLLGFKGVALVRGELGNRAGELNPRLAFVRDCGLELVSVTRGDYRQLRTSAGLAALQRTYAAALILPEGGRSPAALTGLAELMDWVPAETRTLACACGTATTLAGLIGASSEAWQLLGVAVLKGSFLAAEVHSLLQGRPIACRWEIEDRFHAGGYARVSAELTAFIDRFRQLNPGIPIEPIYTGKLLWALNQRLSEGRLTTPLTALHCGGLLPVPAD